MMFAMNRGFAVGMEQDFAVGTEQDFAVGTEQDFAVGTEQGINKSLRIISRRLLFSTLVASTRFELVF